MQDYTSLKNTFIDLLKNYTENQVQIETCWSEIEMEYGSKKRHYHTLEHINSLLKHLLEIKEEIENWESILFTLYYHDVIYNSLKSNNEEKSALVAEKRMKELAVPNSTIELCVKQILATKSHLESTDSDTNFFLDADLSALGLPWDAYSIYYKNVRKEYSIYPDFLYNPGRKKVLKHFLEMHRIYKTDYFHGKFEQQAKENLRKELNVL